MGVQYGRVQIFWVAFELYTFFLFSTGVNKIVNGPKAEQKIFFFFALELRSFVEKEVEETKETLLVVLDYLGHNVHTTMGIM